MKKFEEIPEYILDELYSKLSKMIMDGYIGSYGNASMYIRVPDYKVKQTYLEYADIITQGQFTEICREVSTGQIKLVPPLSIPDPDRLNPDPTHIDAVKEGILTKKTVSYGIYGLSKDLEEIIESIYEEKLVKKNIYLAMKKMVQNNRRRIDSTFWVSIKTEDLDTFIDIVSDYEVDITETYNVYIYRHPRLNEETVDIYKLFTAGYRYPLKGTYIYFYRRYTEYLTTAKIFTNGAVLIQKGFKENHIYSILSEVYRDLMM